MILVIAEKPELGHAVADAIPGTSREDKGQQLIYKTWKGQEVTIAWCFGHLLTLVDPEEYDPKYKEWKLENLPFYFENWRHRPIGASKDNGKSKAPRVAQIGKLLKTADSVIHAGDIDDEGQLLVDELLRYFNYRGPVQRLNTSDTSAAALRRALDNMDDNAIHISSGLAAYGRQLGDKIFGFNLTPYYTIINGTLLRVGRVKMPSLGLAVRRDRLIENHKKIKYYTISGVLTVGGADIPISFVPSKDDSHLVDGRIIDKAYISSIASMLKSTTVSEINVSVEKQLEPPPLPFNLVKLYAYCSNKWGLQPGTVRKITQSLREKHRAITYNRTNCQYLSSAMFAEAPNTVKHVVGNLGVDPSSFDTTIRSRAFNDENVTEHTAIIPTGTPQDLSTFTQDEARVYTAIAQYYLAQFMPPATKMVTKLEAPSVNGGKLCATSTVITEPGYRVVLGSSDLTKTEEDTVQEEETQEASETSLSNLRPGRYNGVVKDTSKSEKETKPLPHYTAATLIADMTSIAKYVENPAIKKLLLQKDKGKKDEHGSIGTPATRDTIVKELVDCGYLREEKKGKTIYLISTQLGREFYDTLPDSVRKVDVSAKWWCKQEQIRAGEITPDDMARDVLKTVAAIIQSGQGVMENASQYAAGIVNSEPIGKCPKCGGEVFETAKGFKCGEENCKFAIFKRDKFFASLGKELTAKGVQIMLKNGRIAVKNCKSKKGTTYDAVVLCDFTSGDYPEYSFADDSELEQIGICPKCHSAVVAKGGNYRCINKDCKFVLWSSNKLLESIGKKLSAANARDLLQYRRCKLSGCKSKKNPGKTYSCVYVVDFSGEYVQGNIEFPR